MDNNDKPNIYRDAAFFAHVAKTERARILDLQERICAVLKDAQPGIQGDDLWDAAKRCTAAAKELTIINRMLTLQEGWPEPEGDDPQFIRDDARRKAVAEGAAAARKEAGL